MAVKHTLQFCTLFLAGSIVAAPAMAQDRYADDGSYGEGLTTLEQGWNEEERDRFYHEPQGSPIMPYDWFLKLEQADSQSLFRDDAFLRSFGMITSGTTHRNPDALPIGLTKDLGIHKVEQKLGMNCGACHVSEVSYQGNRVLIDGGASHFNFWRFMSSLEEALQQTFDDDTKFERFAIAVLDQGASETQKSQLRARLRGVLETRQDWSIRNATHVTPGPGRVDALNVILNEVTAQMLDRPDNARPSDAPVSYPFVWDAPYLDYVQYNAVVPNAGAGAMARNVGQVLGVFGEVSVIPSTRPLGYASSVRMDHLIVLEETMETLISPSWQEMADKGILPTLEQDKLEQGRQLYAANCAGCHVSINRTNRGELASIPVTKVPLEDVGTEAVASLDFSAREVATGPLFGRRTDFIAGQSLCERTHADQLLAHVTVAAMLHDLRDTGAPIVETLASATFSGLMDSVKGLFSPKPEEPAETDQALIARMAQGGASDEEIVAALKARGNNKTALYELLVADGLDRHGENRRCLEVLENAVYRARPLNGIWATGPFLHNGSVPSLHDMLLPPDQRPQTFYVGSRELDPIRVGFVNEQNPRTMEFDTTIVGNGNQGHTYGTTLSSSEKEALLEYLKGL